MIINSLRFGKTEIDDDKLFKFADGIPGFDSLHLFALLECEETYPVLWLQSAEDGDISLAVIDPFIITKDYSFDLNDDDASSLGITGEISLEVYNVVVIRDDIKDATMNMLAPIILNADRRIGKQIFVDKKEYSHKTPIYNALMEFLAEEKGNENKGGDGNGNSEC